MRLNLIWKSRTVGTNLTEGDLARQKWDPDTDPRIMSDRGFDSDEFDSDDLHTMLTHVAAKFTPLTTSITTAVRRLNNRLLVMYDDYFTAHSATPYGARPPLPPIIARLRDTMTGLYPILRGMRHISDFLSHHVADTRNEGLGYQGQEAYRFARECLVDLDALDLNTLPKFIRGQVTTAHQYLEYLVQALENTTSSRNLSGRPSRDGLMPATVVSTRGVTMEAEHVVAHPNGACYFVCFDRDGQYRRRANCRPSIAKRDLGLSVVHGTGDGWTVLERFGKVITINNENIQSLQYADEAHAEHNR